MANLQDVSAMVVQHAQMFSVLGHVDVNMLHIYIYGLICSGVIFRFREMVVGGLQGVKQTAA